MFKRKCHCSSLDARQLKKKEVTQHQVNPLRVGPSEDFASIFYCPNMVFVYSWEKSQRKSTQF